MFRMKWQSMFLFFILLTGWCFRPVNGDFVASDEHSDIGNDEGVHPIIRRETNADDPDMRMETNWDVPNMNEDNYGDADWHPPSSLLETHSDLTPDAPLVVRSDNTDADDGANPAMNQNVGSSSSQCGDFSSHLTSNGQCRLTASLPPVGTSQKRCPDMFRCTDDVSYWLHENRNRKDQLEELKETVSELQEELRNHQQRVKTLEMQSEESLSLNSTFQQRLRSLEQRQAEADTLLHVHAALLHELQAQLRNLSDTVQGMSHNTGCTVSILRATPPLGMRDTLPPDGKYLSFCPSDCASLFYNGVRRSGVYTIVMSSGSTLPVYCDMETE
ncbi:angiopoietin-4-like, partial [Stegastes partitus]|uniref:Angiopoietin-4-like n=1 Tax=Stegastes partitus TaxID=144197 RepID=A0A9Y4K6Y9_9TELE